ncbi:UNVERIFIED_CONTAM: hypothetical protein ABID98_002395 [Brevibacillus sp. OAP136]
MEFFDCQSLGQTINFDKTQYVVIECAKKSKYKLDIE